MAHINAQLNKIYNMYWPSLISAASLFSTAITKPANPLLLAINEEAYDRSDLKVMYCGQETFGWLGNLGGKSVDEVISVYQHYFTDGEYLQKEAGKRAFWRAVRKFNAAIESALPGRTIYPIWNNISKIGVSDRKGMTNEIRTLERKYFPVFQEELALLNPDLVIFMTGPNRDGDIRFNLPDAVFDAVSNKITKRSLARVTSSGLKSSAIRLYHPAYFGGFNKVSSAALDEITKILTNSNAFKKETPNDY